MATCSLAKEVKLFASFPPSYLPRERWWYGWHLFFRCIWLNKVIWWLCCYPLPSTIIKRSWLKITNGTSIQWKNGGCSRIYLASYVIRLLGNVCHPLSYTLLLWQKKASIFVLICGYPLRASQLTGAVFIHFQRPKPRHQACAVSGVMLSVLSPVQPISHQTFQVPKMEVLTYISRM